jgi:multidrug efflux pump subunit AcrA (membrane-fusion protein)
MLALCTILMSIGGIAGFLLRPVILPANHDVPGDSQNSSTVVDPAHGSSSVVEILEVTMENMNLQTGKFEVRDYYKRIRIPAQVVERIPQSRRSISAPIGGRVSKVFIASGQAVRPGEKLFELQITDPSISESQVKLLAFMSETDVFNKQMERLNPLVEKGIVAQKRILEIEFQIAKLDQQKAALIQELGIRGMTAQQIEDLIETQQLVQDVVVFAPEIGVDRSSRKVLPIADESTSVRAEPVSLETESTLATDTIGDDQYFTVETIAALEGTNLEMGQSLCELTHHSELLIKGLAFESDVELISKANARGWRFSARFGEGSAALVRENLKLYLIENHVDKESQTFPIFVEINNEIISQTTDNHNRMYVNWRFKPGQRAHLEVPVEKWDNQVVVPLAALVREGLESFVFQKIGHTHESNEGTVHEFLKVPVMVLHTDQNHAVLKKDVRLDIYEDYALDQAYQLNLALKQAAGGGADPHAGHNH